MVCVPVCLSRVLFEVVTTRGSYGMLVPMNSYNIAADYFKYEITPSLKANGRLKFDQDVAFNWVREKRITV